MILTVDTLEFASRESDEKKLINFLQLNNVKFLSGRSPQQGYDYAFYYQGIIISFKSDGPFHSYVTFSGKGCRALESILGADENKIPNFWRDYIINLCNNIDPDFRRIDIAADDRSGAFDVYTCIKYYAAGKFAGAVRRVVGHIFDEQIFYAGSPRSDALVRIYNKALERGYSEADLGSKWLRVEMQLRHGNAQQLINEWLGSDNLQKYFCGHLLYLCRFLAKPNDKKNSQRINTAGFWKDFIGRVEKIPFVSSPGSDYNKSKLQRFLDNQCASSIKTRLLLDGDDYVREFLSHFLQESIILNPDQKALINFERSKGDKIYDHAGRVIGYDKSEDDIPFDIDNLQTRLDLINSILRSASLGVTASGKRKDPIQITLEDLQAPKEPVQINFEELLKNE